MKYSSIRILNFFLFIAIIAPISCTTIQKKMSCINWKPDGLKHEDFTGNCGNSPFQGYCYSILNREKSKRFDSSIKVGAVFVKEKSFLLNYKDELLKHEQYHFNITELYARIYRKIIDYNQVDSFLAANINYTKQFDSVSSNKYFISFLTIKSILSKVQQVYDNQTNHSANRDIQIIWENNIDSLLNIHKGFYRNYPDSIFLFKVSDKLPIDKKDKIIYLK